MLHLWQTPKHFSAPLLSMHGLDPLLSSVPGTDPPPGLRTCRGRCQGCPAPSAAVSHFLYGRCLRRPPSLVAAALHPCSLLSVSGLCSLSPGFTAQRLGFADCLSCLTLCGIRTLLCPAHSRAPPLEHQLHIAGPLGCSQTGRGTNPRARLLIQLSQKH